MELASVARATRLPVPRERHSYVMRTSPGEGIALPEPWEHARGALDFGFGVAGVSRLDSILARAEIVDLILANCLPTFY